MSIKRIMSLFLCMALMLGNLGGISVFADSDENATAVIQPVTEEDLEIVGSFSEGLDSFELLSASGVSDDGLSWALEKGMLKITGSGEMSDYTADSVPWNEVKQSVKFIYVDDDITNIGDYAFYGLENAKSVYIPDSVTEIGISAFEKCTELKEVVLSESLETIGNAAFRECVKLKDITIPDSVTSIGLSVFANCNKLKEIEVSEDNSNYVSEDGVLFNKEKTVLIAFPGHNKNHKYTIPYGVTEIAEFAFDTSVNLTDITLPETLVRISAGAFNGCSSISKINIPASVTEIAENAFSYGCSSLAELNVSEGNTVYASENGVLLNKDKTVLIKFPENCTKPCDGNKYTIPSTVKTIGDEAFFDCTTVKELYIHGGLAEIGRAAFMQFESLTDIWFDGTKISWDIIPKGAFNEKLEEVTIHFVEANYQTTFNAELGLSYDIDDFVDFQGNEDLKASAVITSSNPDVASIRDGRMYAMNVGEAVVTAVLRRNGMVIAVGTKVTVVEEGSKIQTSTYTMVEGATWNIKDNIKESGEDIPTVALRLVKWASTDERVVTVDDGLVTAVGAGEASVIASLKTTLKGQTIEYKARCDIKVTPKYTDESYFKFDNGVITEYIGTDKIVKIPDEIGGITVTRIGRDAFSNCTHITNVVLPSTIKRIDYYAFRNCKKLAEITLNEGLTSVSDYAFYYCTSLVKITIPSTLTTSARYWFVGCSRLNTVAFAEGTTTIYPVLRNSSVKKVILPESVKTISQNAFYGCSNLKEINIPKNVTTIGLYAFSNCTSLRKIDMSKATALTSISNYAFYRCSNLQNVVFSPALKSIGYMAFCACYGITDITIPDSVTTIGGYAFENCSGLKTVKLGLGLTSLGYGAFYYCYNLTSINIPDKITKIDSYTFYYCQSLQTVELSDSLAAINNNAFYNCLQLKSITMPDTVKTIGSYAFYGCRKLSAITLSNTLTTIGSSAFYYCSTLTNVTIPDSVISIGTYAFAYCSNLRGAKLSSNLTSLPSYVFYNCNSLSEIAVPDKVTSIGKSAFYNCSRLNKVIFGSGLKNIYGYAFYNCTYLSSVSLPDTVTSLGDYAFAYCRNISNLKLSESLTAIGYSAFYYCSGIKNLVIPDSVKTIGNYAFYCCTSISSIDFGESVYSISNYAFYKCTSLKSIVIPDSVRYIYNYAFGYCSKLNDITMGKNVTYLSYSAFIGCPVISDVFDKANSHFKVSDETNAGYIPLEVKYKFKDNANVSNTKIAITMPNSAFIVSGSMKLDGKEYSNYKERQGNGSSANKITDIFVENNSGTIKFCIKPSEYKNITVYADVICSSIFGNKTERIGYLNCALPEITVSTADVTSQATFVVEGMALPNRTVSLYIDGDYKGKTSSNSVGNYKCYVTLNNPVNYSSYTVEAKVQNYYGETKTAETKVQYVKDNPTLTGLVMYYGKDGYSKQSYNLFGLIKPPVIAWGNYWNGSGKGYSYTFNVKLSNRDQVDKVYVVSTKNGKKSYLEARWNSYQQAYVTSGHFDGDCEYIPNIVTIEFTKKIDDVKLTLSEMLKYMDFGSEDVSSSITDFTTTSFSATVTVSRLLKNVFGDQIDISVDSSERDYSVSNNDDVYTEREGYYAFPVNENGLNCVVSFDLSDSENAAVYIHDITNSRQTTYSMSFKTFDADGNETKLSVSDIFDKIDAYAGRMMNLYNLNMDMEKLIDGLGKTTLSEEQMMSLIKRAEQLNIKKKMFMLTSMVLSASMMNNISAPSEILDILSGLLNKDIRFFGELKLLVTYKLGLDYRIRWTIDPSGYVYEGVTDNRLEGVTTTLYYIDNNDLKKIDDTTYDLENIDMSKVHIWNADDFDQSNPLQTDESGKYSWMVPEQCHYQVKYEKEGYETAYSEWLPVPPVQNDVNIGLVSKAAPNVEKIYVTPEFMVIYFDKYMIPDTVKNITGIADGYEITYDTTQKDLAGTNFASEFVVKFKDKLEPGTELDISVADAQSYASVEMTGYTGQVTVSDVKNELSVSGVEPDGTNLTVEYFNNTGDFLTYKAICAVYGDDENFIGVKMLDVEKLKSAGKVKKLFVFEDEWSKYKIFAWSVEKDMQPVMKVKDSE